MERHGLLLFTNVFPFGKGEEFLENELPSLAEAFDEVVVVATQTTSAMQQARELPPNVRAIRAGGPRPRGRAGALSIVRGMGLLARRRLDGLTPDPRRAAMDAQFVARADRVVREAWPQLQAMGLGNLTSLTVYAYWFHVAAFAAAEVADRLRRSHPSLDLRKVVSRAHRYDLYEDVAPLGHIPMRRQLLSRLDAVHPVSEDGTDHLRERYPQFAAKVSTRRLGTFGPGAPVEPHREPFHVVSCSFLLPVKRVDRFAGILKLVKDAGVDVRWTHFGPGDDLERIRGEATRLLGAGSAELPGYVRNVELPDRYRALHPSVFMNLSASEGVPVSIMEAAALGMPVVATDVGGTSEIVRDGEDGMLVPQDFTDREVADVLVGLATRSDEDFAALGRRGREIWESEFDASKVYPAWASYLRS